MTSSTVRSGAQVTGDHLGGLLPRVDLAREKLLAEVLTAASSDGLTCRRPNDLSEGGLIQAVVESGWPVKPVAASCFPRTWTVRLPLLESAGRVLVAVPRTEESRFRSMCEARGLRRPIGNAPTTDLTR